MENVLDDQSTKIVENVLLQCKHEAYNNRILGGLLSSYKERASFYTRLPKRVIDKIKVKNFFPESNISVRLAVNKVLKKFYSKQEQPSYKLVYDMVKVRNVDLLDQELFTFQLLELGYVNVHLLNSPPPGQMIMENPKLTFERYRYIKKILNARAMNNKIYYIGVRIYDQNKKIMVPFNIQCKDELLSQTDLLILYHIVSKDGYENGLFSYSYEQSNFITWILNILMAKLQPSSFIVIDNSSQCGKPPTDSNITRYHPKKDMMKWLTIHNLPCAPSMHKAELFELIDKSSIKIQNNNVENVLRSMGHNVLCLPTHIDDLSPIELLWKDINEKLKKFNPAKTVMKSAAIKEVIADEISSLCHKGMWGKYDQIIKNSEKELFGLDNEIDNYLDKYEIDLDNIVYDSDKKLNAITLV